MAITPGARIGPYEVLSQLGQGAMGVVYRARDTRLRRDVAIKILPDHLAHDADRLVRFQREAQALAALNHQNIAQIYGLEETDSGCIVMELVEGETLADLVRRGPVPMADAVHIARQLADALAAAHERGIVHRDLKPANIKLTPDGQVKVLDFGLAKALSGRAGESGATSSTTQGTMAGAVMGTAPYMSPEQARGKEVDARTDIWAFGCVLYELLTGAPAFEGETITDVLAKIVTGHPDWTRLPEGTPTTIRTLLTLTLERDVKQRLQHVGDARPFLNTEIFADTHGKDQVRPPRPWLLTGALGIAIAAVLVFAVLYFRSRTHDDAGGTAQQSTRPAADSGTSRRDPSASTAETPAPPAALPPPPVPATTVAPASSPDSTLAREAWERVKGSGNRAALEAFLRAYGTTEYASPARVELALLSPAEKPSSSPSDPRAGQERTNLKDTQRYVWIPPGTFLMGCSPGDNQCLDDERPPHKVEISRGFWLGQTPVTVGPWQRYRAQTNVPPLPGQDLLGRKINGSAGDATVPVVTIKWDMARAFCDWAGGRLPTEAEWEYAARAGATGSRYGDIDNISWYAENSGRQRIDTSAMQTLSREAYEKALFENGNGPHPVGQKQANAWNLYDMLGNVLQWTADIYSRTYYSQSATRDPAGALEGDAFVTRGGSWFTPARAVRLSSRAPIPKFEVRGGLGFRCAIGF